MEVREEEGKKFADENDAIFQLTSAKDGSGINELFEEIGKKFLRKKNKIKKAENKKTKNKDKLGKCVDF